MAQIFSQARIFCENTSQELVINPCQRKLIFNRNYNETHFTIYGKRLNKCIMIINLFQYTEMNPLLCFKD